MAIPASLAMSPLPGEAHAAFAHVDATQWSAAAREVSEAGGRLAALWGADRRAAGDGFAAYAAYATPEGLAVLRLDVPDANPAYPDLAGVFPAARRMQRALRDLLGLAAQGAADERPWLRHGAWGAREFPLRRDFDAARTRLVEAQPYPFVGVEGDGVHEIPVGPIHAGIIEPGHFRFSVVGEKVLRLEERLGYTHKGIDRRFTGFAVADGYRLAGRCCGDSTVAYAWAYAQAAEALLGAAPPPRARWLRALMLECERIANHLNDLGALGNDGGFGFALAQFSRLREDWLRLLGAAFGHRLMMDRIVPGGTAADLDAAQAAQLCERAVTLEREVHALHAIFEEHSGLQDRFLTAGRVEPDLARALGLAGLAGRASGQAYDLRVDFPIEPYASLGVRKVVYTAGDVSARVRARFDELFEALRLVGAIAQGLPAGPVRTDLGQARPGAFGVGRIEGWRGEVLMAIEAGAGGRIGHAHAHDPSWQNWPLIEHAVMGNIVPDFPLINKSFNLAYSGTDG
jgi:Ni,Fe-hydrogenase III large subunit/Ni,Fe-hydrogenase III component G